MDNELPRKPLKDWRLSRYLTQGELAERVGVTLHTISDWETGIHPPRIRFIPILAQALGITPEQIIWPEKGERKKGNAVAA